MNCIGDWVITQKWFTVDFLEKKMKVNEGEVPQYYIEESHQPSSTLWSLIRCRQSLRGARG